MYYKYELKLFTRRGRAVSRSHLLNWIALTPDEGPGSGGSTGCPVLSSPTAEGRGVGTVEAKGVGLLVAKEVDSVVSEEAASTSSVGAGVLGTPSSLSLSDGSTLGLISTGAGLSSVGCAVGFDFEGLIGEFSHHGLVSLGSKHSHPFTTP